MRLRERLAAIVEGMPSGSSVSLPVDWLRDELEESAPASARAKLDDLTAAQLGKEIGRAPSTVRTWLAEGRIEGAYLLRNREWRIPRTAARAFLDAMPNGLAPRPQVGRPPRLDAYRSVLRRREERANGSV